MHLGEPERLLGEGRHIRRPEDPANRNRPWASDPVLPLPGRAQMGHVVTHDVGTFVRGEVGPFPRNAESGRTGLFHFDEVVANVVVPEQS